jgi:RNA polymerase-binding transcription factor DksA
MLTAKERDELATLLRRQRRALFDTVAAAERDLEFIAEDRESELEEHAQDERAARLAARLDDRGKLEIEAIDAALWRLAEGRYGECVRCNALIPLERLRVVPATLHCVACAQAPAVPAVEGETESKPSRHAAARRSQVAERP